MSGADNFLSALSTTQKAINSAQSVTNSVSRVASTSTRVLNTGDKLIGKYAGTSTASRTATAASAQAASNGEIDGGLIAPEGTCIILPPQVTGNGKARYLGKDAYQTIVDMINGKETLANALVLDDNMQLSSKVYDVTSSGVFLKGTQTPVDVKYENNKPVGVYLSEREYEACVKGITSTDQNTQKFTTSSELGKAEDVDNRAWYLRWLKEIIIGTTIVLGGGLIFWLVNRQRKKTKKANNQVNDLTQQTGVLTDKIADLQKQNTLADNATKVNDAVIDAATTFMQVNNNANGLG